MVRREHAQGEYGLQHLLWLSNDELDDGPERRELEVVASPVHRPARRRPRIAAVVDRPCGNIAFSAIRFRYEGEADRWVKKNVTVPKRDYWLDQDVINHELGPARAGREPYATWLNLPDDAPIPCLRNVEVVVVGGSGNLRWSVNECGYSRSVRVNDWR
jgi:hypothetical protein